MTLAVVRVKVQGHRAEGVDRVVARAEIGSRVAIATTRPRWHPYPSRILSSALRWSEPGRWHRRPWGRTGRAVTARGLVVVAAAAVVATAACGQAQSGAGSAAPSVSPSAVGSLAATVPPPTPNTTPPTPTPGQASTSNPPTVIPWVDASVARLIVPDVNAVVVHHAAYRPCTARNLAGRTTGGGAGLGVGTQQLTFTNISSTPCTLAGGPLALIGVTRAAGHLVVAGPGAGAGLHLDEVANLLPAGVGYADVIGPRYDKCITDPTYASLEVQLADHTVVAIATPKPWERLTVGCHYDLSAFGTPHHYLPQPTYPTDPLVTTATMPAKVTAGSTIPFTVTMTNPTRRVSASHAVPDLRGSCQRLRRLCQGQRPRPDLPAQLRRPYQRRPGSGTDLRHADPRAHRAGRGQMGLGPPTRIRRHRRRTDRRQPLTTRRARHTTHSPIG